MNELRTAIAAFRRGETSVALELVNIALRDNENCGASWELFGMIRHREQQHRSAVIALERAASLLPLSPEGTLSLAEAYRKIERPESAVNALTSLVRDSTLSSSHLLQAAAAFSALEMPDLAMRTCRTAARRDANNPRVLFELGFYASRCGLSPRVTISLAKQAIRLEPNNVGFRVGLACFLLSRAEETLAYEVVNEFSTAQLREVCCCSCLERLANLYEAMFDGRAEACRYLIATRTPSDEVVD